MKMYVTLKYCLLPYRWQSFYNCPPVQLYRSVTECLTLYVSPIRTYAWSISHRVFITAVMEMTIISYYSDYDCQIVYNYIGFKALQQKHPPIIVARLWQNFNFFSYNLPISWLCYRRPARHTWYLYRYITKTSEVYE